MNSELRKLTTENTKNTEKDITERNETERMTPCGVGRKETNGDNYEL